jgi:hypothetical protein
MFEREEFLVAGHEELGLPASTIASRQPCPTKVAQRLLAAAL